MIFDWEPINNWFGFTRRERRSTLILLIILILLIVLRYIVPQRNTEAEIILTGFSGINSRDEVSTDGMSPEVRLFSFDPNRVSYDTLIILGLASKEANTLIKYRNRGGKFIKPSDIRKVYGIEGEKADRLIPFIDVAVDTTQKVLTNTSRQQKTIIDINSCDSVSLIRLPGIGPVLSARIIKYRRLLGGFARTDQLKEVYGLSVETFDLIKGRVYADTSVIVKINVNAADFKELSRNPYFENYEVQAILKYRELTGRIAGIDDLIENKLITAEKSAKVGPYLKFE